MTLATFFERFDTFADAPDAVAKMRELVLHLAVTGKLVGQNSSDESGELLLKRINAERLAAVKSRQISPMKPLPDVGEDELLFELQPGWAVARLIELVMEIQTGPFGSTLHKSDYQLGGTPVINPASLKDGKIVPIEAMAIGHATLKRLEGFKLKAGNIVMARRGEMGRCAIVTEMEDGWLCGTGSLVLRMPRSIYAPFLAMLIGAPMARTYLGGASVGTTMQNLNQSILAKMPVGVPPLAEQRRIVAKVDELMALCDRLEAQQQERQTRHADLARASLARFAAAPTPANLRFLFHQSYTIPPADLRKSILTLAVQGNLVRFETENEAQTVGDHIEFQNGYAFKSQWFKPDGMRLCRNVNVSHGIVDWRESAFVDDDVAKEFERFALSEGDIVLSLDRPLITTGLKVARIRKSDLPCLLLQRVAKPEAKHDQLDMSYFFLWLNSPEFVDSIDPGRSNGVPHISTRQVQLLPFALPPLAEQRRIVAKVDHLMALVDALETQLATSRATAKNLLEAAVAELTAADSLSPPIETAIQPRNSAVLDKRQVSRQKLRAQ